MFLLVVSVGLVFVVFGSGTLELLSRSPGPLRLLRWRCWGARGEVCGCGARAVSTGVSAVGKGFEYGRVQFSGGAPRRKAVGEIVEIETDVGVFRCEKNKSKGKGKGKGKDVRHSCRGRMRGGVLEAGVGGVRFVCDKSRGGRWDGGCRDVVLNEEELAAAHAVVLYATEAGGIAVKRARSSLSLRLNR